MDLQKFKQTYAKVISESADNSEIKNYIKSIVEEVLDEYRVRSGTDEFYTVQYTKSGNKNLLMKKFKTKPELDKWLEDNKSDIKVNMVFDPAMEEEVLDEARIPTTRDPKIRLIKNTYPNLYAAIHKVADPAYKQYPTYAYYMDDKVPYDETQFLAKLDKLEKLASTENGMKSKELKKFLSTYVPTKREREPIQYDRSKDPTVDADGYPINHPYGWKPFKSEMDDWIH